MNLKVCRGITRTVLLVGKWAIKVPSLRAHEAGLTGLLWSLSRGILANQSELEWSGQPGLCPVLFSFGGVVNVYPRCQPVDYEPTEAEYEAIAPFSGPSDRKPHNIGLLGDKLVWVDYDMNWNDQSPCRHVRRGEQP